MSARVVRVQEGPMSDRQLEPSERGTMDSENVMK